jgi:hypothetical protein
LKLRASDAYDPSETVWYDTSAAPFTTPHVIGTADWDDWIFYRTQHEVDVDSTIVDVPLRTVRDGNPLLVSQRRGRGRITYVNLTLGLQWLNVHPGSFRFLANLISY